MDAIYCNGSVCLFVQKIMTTMMMLMMMTLLLVHLTFYTRSTSLSASHCLLLLSSRSQQVLIIWLRLVSDVVPYLIFNISMHHDRCWSGTKWQGRKKEELLVYER